MTTMNDIKVTINESLDPLEKLMEDLDGIPKIFYDKNILEIIEDLEHVVEVLAHDWDLITDLIG